MGLFLLNVVQAARSNPLQKFFAAQDAVFEIRKIVF